MASKGLNLDSNLNSAAVCVQSDQLVVGQRFAAALLPQLRLFGTNPTSHQKGV